MDDIDFFGQCTRDVPPRPSDLFASSIASPIPFVNIPKRIFQVGNDNLGKDSFIQNHSGWHYRLIDMSEIRSTIQNFLPEFLSTYDSCKYEQQKENIAIYVMMYLYGGVYVSKDFQCSRNLGELFYSDAEVYLTFSPIYTFSLTNSFFGSKSRSKFWLEVLREADKQLKTSWNKGKLLTTSMTTGSGLINRVVQDTTIPLMLLPISVVTNGSVCQRRNNDKPFLHQIGSDNGWDSKAASFCWCNRNWISYVVIGILILIFVLLIFGWFRKPSSKYLQYMPHQMHQQILPVGFERGSVYPNW